jgi:uncharacterized repeat protein (TIGR01451 family)
MAQTIISATVLTPVCPGSSGAVQLTFSGATYPFTLVWHGGNMQSSSAVITSSPQTITIVGFNQNRSSNGTEARFYVDSPWKFLGKFPVGITFDPVSTITATCASGANIMVDNIQGGTGPYTLSLVDMSTGLAAARGSSPLNVPFSQICPISGKASLKIEDSNGCYAAIDSLWINCIGLSIALTKTDAACTNGSVTVSSVTGGRTPYNYRWSNGATSSSIKGLVKGRYTCRVYDATGCYGERSEIVNQKPIIRINSTTKPATCNNPDGEATLFPTGGAAPYTYAWSNGASTQNVKTLAPAVTHNVIVTDVNGCSGEAEILVGSVSPVYVNYSSTASACTSATGTAELSVYGGTPPYKFKWFSSASVTNKATGLAAGFHSFLITDSKGCERNGTVNIPPISYINARISKTDAICPSNAGSMNVAAFGNAEPLRYAWSNGDSSTEISGLSGGFYSCTITDANNCAVTRGDKIAVKSPINLNFSTFDANCIYDPTGRALVKALGGTPPYTYSWSNGGNTPLQTGLVTGHYYVSVTDSMGCKSNADDGYVFVGYNKFNNTCYCTLLGVVYNDLDGNCTKDANEPGIPDVLIEARGFGFTSTDANGRYSFKLPAGTYTIREVLDNYSSLSSCQNNGITKTITTNGFGCTHIVDFANQLIPYHDIVTLLVSYNRPIPGNTYLQKHVVKNRGNFTENDIRKGFEHDGQLTWQNMNGAPLVNRGNNYFQYSSPFALAKGESIEFLLDYFTNTSLPLGTQLYFQDSVAHSSPVSTYWVNNEETPWNNLLDDYETVYSSYDPNYKEVFPKGVSTTGKIPTQTRELTFVTHFENNGTAHAQKVVVIDSLDSKLQPETFKFLHASHKVQTEIRNGTVVFTFDNINLDYTPVGVPNTMAQGYVAYTIRPKQPVKEGMILNTKADIYFDYNPPITTNETFNTFSDALSTFQPAQYDPGEITLFPNPANTELNLIIPESFSGLKTIHIFNLIGQVEQFYKVNENQQELDIRMLQSGFHIVKVTDAANRISVAKFIKQ